MKKKKIKSTAPPESSSKIRSTDTDIIEMPNYDYPIYCLKHLHPEYGLNQCESEDKIAFVDRLAKLCSMTWQEIHQAPRHGLGSEKISVASLNVKPPPFLTEDVEYLLALRFNGKKPFLCHRNRFVCHVIFIDRNFSIYDHG